jgi:hypothetical protein
MACVTSKALFLAAALLFPAALSSQSGTAAAASPCIDVALVLAVDSSASVSPGEYLLQQQGIAAAFRNDAVLNAMAQAGRVAVSVVFWGSDNQPKPQSDWMLIDGPGAAETFAQVVEAMPRQVSGDTGLGAGLMAAIGKFGVLEQCSLRKIVNVSGDGEETRATRGTRRAALPPAARDLAEAMQVEINALAIVAGSRNLTAYFEANVITGPDAFVMEANDFAAFADALRRKLVREISPRVVSGLAEFSPRRMP